MTKLAIEPAEVYHAKAKEYLSSHQLADYRKCPLLYHRKRLGLISQKDSTAYLVGRAAHTLILEGSGRYQLEYAVGGPINPKTEKPYGPTTKAFAEWAERIGKPVLSDDQAALIEQMAAGVATNPNAVDLLTAGQAEGVVRCEYEDVQCQARIDWFTSQNQIVDLKTCFDLDRFEDDFHAYGYAYQLAFYRALLIKAHKLPVQGCYVIAVEKREPFRCGVWSIGPEMLDAAQRENEQAIGELLESYGMMRWPTRYEKIRELA